MPARLVWTVALLLAASACARSPEPGDPYECSGFGESYHDGTHATCDESGADCTCPDGYSLSHFFPGGWGCLSDAGPIACPKLTAEIVYSVPMKSLRRGLRELASLLDYAPRFDAVLEAARSIGPDDEESFAFEVRHERRRQDMHVAVRRHRRSEDLIVIRFEAMPEVVHTVLRSFDEMPVGYTLPEE